MADDHVATWWAKKLGSHGVPMAAASELGRYFSSLEKRITELEKREGPPTAVSKDRAEVTP